MDSKEQHINEVLKKKFENFSPQPPERVWEGITTALDKQLVPAWYNTLAAKIVAAVLIGIFLLAGYWLLENNFLSETSKVRVVAKQALPIIKKKTAKSNTTGMSSPEVVSENTVASNTGQTPVLASQQKSLNKKAPVVKTSSAYDNLTKTKEMENSDISSALSQVEVNHRKGNIDIMESKFIVFNTLDTPLKIEASAKKDEGKATLSSLKKKQLGKLALGIYFAPEIIFDPFDSLTIQNSYAINIEPVYYFNNHWFVRPGLGLQYARDKGFVKTDYLSWDYMGSYNDVVDVTIDTTGGVMTPIYHTKEREVYDSIRHFSVTEETNRYLYLLTSVVVGYHNHSEKIGWSMYAGPAINFVLYNKRDIPVDDNTSIISMDYNLPERKSPQYHIKLGFGLDYRIGRNWLVTVELEYRYFINGLNGGGIYNNSLSGIGTRFGFVYTLK